MVAKNADYRVGVNIADIMYLFSNTFPKYEIKSYLDNVEVDVNGYKFYILSKDNRFECSLLKDEKLVGRFPPTYKTGTKESILFKLKINFETALTLAVEKITPIERIQQPSTNELPLVEDLFPCSDFPYYKYPFETFNKIQSTILNNSLHVKDANLILGTATSTGKTISAELFIWETLSRNKKVCYVSPLRALTSEKYDEWKVTFKGYKICILTGDFVMTAAKEKEINDADIIVVTNEMLASRTRNNKSEKSKWIQDIALLIMDETHIISVADRGHTSEYALMSFTQLNKDARILLLSGTLPNVNHFSEWLTLLNGKQTNIINNPWRPIPLEWYFDRVDLKDKSYFQQQQDKCKEVLEIAKKYYPQKTIIFVHDKATGRNIKHLLDNENLESKFYHSTLPLAERTEILNHFKDNSENTLPILISTSGTAWGVNFAAVNVIIVGTTRGIQQVDEIDFLQMAGRSGRYGLADIGRCHLICDNLLYWKSKVLNPKNIDSTLLNVDYLQFHLMAEIALGNVLKLQDCFKWLSRSLAAIQRLKQDEILNNLVVRAISELKRMEMITEDDLGKYSATKLGKLSASYYFFPSVIYHWYVGLKTLKAKNLQRSDLSVSYVLGTTPTMGLDFVPKDVMDEVIDYTNDVSGILNTRAKQSVLAMELYNRLTEQKSAIYSQQFIEDIERIFSTVQRVGFLCGYTDTSYTDILKTRIKYAVREGLAKLCMLPGIGVARAEKLYSNGIYTKTDVLENKELVVKLLGKNIGNAIIQSLK